ncbi:uncharacterized protein LOC117755322 isoform X1 [Hippoglossus hippoglossus]|uniref:uncharacterized protein LOC117755322 isoform X1 n=1 Tax=Hippoglossus hippoglossus TaxID=8267 RepID=UPI00148CDA62|nr:uncharacterized protein LOC117755322 isoform X1 [Hippoglossus hippoglossus]
MATVTPRRTLVFEIQKRLSDLSVSQLRRVVSYIDTTSRVDELSEPELYDLIVDYIRGEELTALEDEGMAQLLAFDDMLSDLLATDPSVGEVQIGDSTSHQQGSSTPPHPDHNHLDGYPSTFTDVHRPREETLVCQLRTSPLQCRPSHSPPVLVVLFLVE